MDTWWISQQPSNDMVCLYCGLPTTSKEHDEHVVPESLGFKEVLYPGAVCTRCNQRLNHSVDSPFLRDPLVCAGLVGYDIPGKRGTRQAIGTVHKSADGITHVSGTSGKPNFHLLSRGVAKCIANICAQQFGTIAVRQHMADLIEYVRAPRNRDDLWPVVFRAMPELSLVPEFRLISMPSPTGGNEQLIIAIGFPGGIFVSTVSRKGLQPIPFLKDCMAHFLAENPQMSSTISFEYVIDSQVSG